MSDVLVAAPTVEPLTRTQAKLHLRETAAGQDALIDSIIAAARGHIETFCRRALVLQTRRLLLDCFPACIQIPRSPLRAVSSIQYLDTAGALQTLDPTLYRVDKESKPGRITPAYGAVWPSSQYVMHAVQVAYTCGHLIPFTADPATDVLTAAGHGFANGDQSQVATLGGAIPPGLAAATNYFVRDATADTLKLAATSAGAALDITGAGNVPNVLGLLEKEIEIALQILVQYFEQRDADDKLLQAAERVLSPFRAMRF